MTTWQLLTTAWDWEPSVLLGCAALLGLYVWALRGRLTGRSLLFLAAVLTVAVALLSPIDVLGDGYLFSAHMLQHLLLMLVAAPLLIMGIPSQLWGKALAVKYVARTESILSNPLLAWLLSVATLWIWHVPALYDAALADENVHIFQHITFLVTAAIFWWPIVTPVKEHRMQALAGIGYLFMAGVSSTVLGIWLTFAQAGLYPFYLHPLDSLGILPLLRQDWGLTPEKDQMAGGLIMWVPGGLVYLAAIMGTLASWYAEPEDDEVSLEQAESLQPAGNS